ncbi:thiol:disulfide interchange protein, partial [Campylobacter jejuni]|nr:thiol:disulfide interchange protein [Campylobacter jejuni]
MRIFGIILLSFCLCFASILSLNEAFNVKSNSYNNSISIDIELGKDIYLYSNKLKLYINEKDISSLINLPQSSTRGNENVYY